MEPELMTADEWANLIGLSAWSKAQGTIRERGMVAPEPVDPLREAVREAWRARWPADRSANSDSYIDPFIKELRARGVTVLAERPTLTWEMVREVVRLASHRAYADHYGYADAIHALLVERLK